jgi:hypothetical protein
LTEKSGSSFPCFISILTTGIYKINGGIMPTPQPSRQHSKQITLIMKNNHLKIAVNKEPKLPQGGEKIIPCKLKKWGFMAMLGAASLLALNSCGKDEPEDPTKAKIEALKAQEKQQAAEVRAAVHPAKYDPDKIQSLFDSEFRGESNRRLGSIDGAKNLPDSAQMFIYVIDGFRASFGDPLPNNNATLTALYEKSKTYIATIEELNQLQK